jgi:Spy/CpxP family protein refolding chaperone
VTCKAHEARNVRPARAACAAAALTLALAAAPALAQQSAAPAPKQAAGWWRQAKVVEQLGLTDTQLAGIETIEQTYRDSRAAAMRVYTQSYAAFMAALTADPTEPAAVESARAAVATAWGELGAVNLTRLAALRGTLTVVQMRRLPSVAPAALRAGPLVVRAIGEMEAAAAPAQP